MIRPRLASHELFLEELRESLFVKNTTHPHQYVAIAWRLVTVIASARCKLGAAISATQLLEDLSKPEDLFQQYSELVLGREAPLSWKEEIELTQIFCPEVVTVPLHTSYSLYIQALLTYITSREIEDETLEQLVCIMGYEPHHLARLTASVRWALSPGDTSPPESQPYPTSLSYSD